MPATELSSAGRGAHVLSPDSLAFRALPRVDYVDVYRVAIDPGLDLDTVARRVFGRPPRLVSVLMRLRDALVGPLGLKTTPRGPRQVGTLARGERLGIFTVFDRTTDELLLGEDDRHLDFRISVRVPGNGTASLATLVRFRNGWGRAYFFVVRPFHVRVARSTLRQAGRPVKPGQAAG